MQDASTLDGKRNAYTQIAIDMYQPLVAHAILIFTCGSFIANLLA